MVVTNRLDCSNHTSELCGLQRAASSFFWVANTFQGWGPTKSEPTTKGSSAIRLFVCKPSRRREWLNYNFKWWGRMEGAHTHTQTHTRTHRHTQTHTQLLSPLQLNASAKTTLLTQSVLTGKFLFKINVNYFTFLHFLIFSFTARLSHQVLWNEWLGQTLSPSKISLYTYSAL